MKTKQLLNQLIGHMLRIQTREEMESFLTGILTPGELEQVSKRLEIVRRLKFGDKQRQIAQDLEIGVATVTRGSRELQLGRFKNVE